MTANATVAISTDKNNDRGSYQYLVFWFKGASSGTAPGLRFQLASGGTIANYFDINGITSGVEWTPAVTTGGSYSTTAISVAAWTKVKVDLTTVAWPVGTDFKDYSLTFRTRSGGTHDWYVDSFMFE